MSAQQTASAVAYEALNLAKSVDQRVNSHEDLCAERYANINKSVADLGLATTTQIAELKGILKWIGVAAFGIMTSLIGFLAIQLWTANNTKIERLERLRTELSTTRNAPETYAPNRP